MKKPSSKIRQEIARLQEQLRQAETRKAECIRRMALRAGLGEMESDEAELLAAFEELAVRFLQKSSRKKDGTGRTKGTLAASVAAGQAAGGAGEA